MLTGPATSIWNGIRYPIREIGSINGVFPKIHERAKSIHLTKINENDNVAKNGSKIVAGNQGAVCFNWVENSELARFSL